MRYTVAMKRLLPFAALAALILAACAAPPAPQPTAAPPSPAATALPPSPAATALPPGPSATALPPGADLLPAPLYLLQGGQIARVERDGATRTVITAVPAPMPGMEPIAEFAVAPDGALAYIVSDVEVDRLIIADPRGQAHTTRYEQQGHELSNMVFTPDGRAIVLRLLNNRQPPDLPSGLYRLPLAGGAPELLQADDVPADPVNPARTVSGYRPVAFSPDGALILLQVYSLFYEDCGYGVIAAAGGPVTRVALPEGVGGYCGEEAWAADGSAALVLAGTFEGAGSGPRLWRADPTSGAAEPLLAEGSFARAPHGMAGGAVRFFLAQLVRDSAGATVGATFAPAELAAPGAAPSPLAQPFDQLLDVALWAPDGAGVVYTVSAEDTAAGLRWQPIGGQPVELAAASAAITAAAWGRDQ